MTMGRRLAAAFSLKEPVLLGHFSPDMCSVKMSQASFLCLEGWEELQGSWPDSGMWDAGSVYELRTSEPPTCENASSSWPTARQEDGESCGNHPGVVDSLTGAAKTWLTPHGMGNEDKTGKKGGAGGGEFALQANNWMSPSAGDSKGRTYTYDQHDKTKPRLALEGQAIWQNPATDSFRSRGGDRKDAMGLDQQARMFPTPASRDYRTPNLKPGSERGMGTKGEQLQNFVEHHTWPTPRVTTGSSISSQTQLDRIRSGEESERGAGACKLEISAELFPPSPPAPAIPDGPQSSESAPTSRRIWPTPDTTASGGCKATAGTDLETQKRPDGTKAQVRPQHLTDQGKRRLNPRFVEFLMGFRIGWTEL
jgi:hypothetical protein